MKKTVMSEQNNKMNISSKTPVFLILFKFCFREWDFISDQENSILFFQNSVIG